MPSVQKILIRQQSKNRYFTVLILQSPFNKVVIHKTTSTKKYDQLHYFNKVEQYKVQTGKIKKFIKKQKFKKFFILILIFCCFSWIIQTFQAFFYDDLKIKMQADQFTSIEILNEMIPLYKSTLLIGQKIEMCSLLQEGIIPQKLLIKLGISNPKKECTRLFDQAMLAPVYLERIEFSLKKLNNLEVLPTQLIGGNKSITFYEDYKIDDKQSNLEYEIDENPIKVDLREAITRISSSYQTFFKRDYYSTFKNIPEIFTPLDKPFNRKRDRRAHFLISNLHGSTISHLDFALQSFYYFIQALGKNSKIVTWIDFFRIFQLVSIVIVIILFIIIYYLCKYSTIYQNLLLIKVSITLKTNQLEEDHKETKHFESKSSS